MIAPDSRVTGSHMAACVLIGLLSCIGIVAGGCSSPRTDPIVPRPADVAATPPIVDATFVSSLADALRLRLEQAVTDGEAPGGVVLVGQGGSEGVALAVGRRVVGDDHGTGAEAMTLDTVFDAASLTKCVVTTTCVLLLIEDGRLHLDDRVGRLMSEFAELGDVTVDHLLRHRSGLIADNALSDYQGGVDLAWRRLMESRPTTPPGEAYVYSDVGFMVLGKLIEKLEGKPLDVVARERVFTPLGMHDSRFVRLGETPAAAWSSRVAPTKPAEAGAAALRGIVHDPRARALGGVAGHAGMFTTARDLARFAAALVDRRPESNAVLGLGAASIAGLADPADLGDAERRGLGFDLRPFANWTHRPGGSLFPLDGFGHTGFTGTSMWIDPRTGTHVVLLTSRLHPDGGGNVAKLRVDVGDIVARALVERPWPLDGDRDATVRLGVERVAAGRWPERFRGRRVGLITNHTGRDRAGTSTIDILHRSPDLRLAALFSPEHGLRGVVDAEVPDDVDARTGLVIHSLYGKTRRPTPETLRDLDVLVFDIQDIGTRFYTYVSTMVWSMEEAAKAGLGFVVLDRPNPIGGAERDGPITDDDALDFVGALRIPVRHGMTVGELARFAKEVLHLSNLDLEVVWMTGWRRTMYQDETGLPWINPSPNMRSLRAALLYPGVGLLETTNVSVGRGTATPFEVLGAPWIDAERLVAEVRARAIPGITVEPTRFTPDASTHAGSECQGLRLTVTDRQAFRAVRFGLEVAGALRRLHTADWQATRYDRLLKHRATMAALLEQGEILPAVTADSDWRLFADAARRARLYD